MATKKEPERLTEQLTIRLTPSLRAWLEAQVGRLRDVRNPSEAARALLERARGSKRGAA